jgi:hypothetical protein
MSDDRRTGEVRDVPSPRPVAGPPAAADEGPVAGLARAARAVADAVAGLLDDAPAEPAGAGADRGRGGAAAGLRDVVAAVAGALAGGRGARAPGAPAPDRSPSSLLGDVLDAVAPRLPIRDAAALRAAHPGAPDEEIADALVARAARLTTRVGAAAGGLAAVHWLAPPSLLAVPLELGAETVVVAAVEVVLVGELHELHGRRPPGDARERATAYLAAWSARRAADRTGAAALGSLGAVGMRALRRRITRRLAGSLPSAAPLLVGAALGGRGNRRATETLAERIRADLRDPAAG